MTIDRSIGTPSLAVRRNPVNGHRRSHEIGSVMNPRGIGARCYEKHKWREGAALRPIAKSRACLWPAGSRRGATASGKVDQGESGLASGPNPRVPVSDLVLNTTQS